MPFLLSLALQLSAGAAAPPDNDRTVVVTAPSRTLRDALDRCVAGGCTTRQDVIASIRYAELQFRGGRYLDARHTLQDAIARVKPAAAAEPVAVAALYEATMTVSLHEGDQDVAKRASGHRLAVLRSAFGEADPRYLQALLDDIDAEVALNPRHEGASRYASLQAKAQRAGLPMIAAGAAMRRAISLHVDGNDQAAARRLRALAAQPGQGAATRQVTDAIIARFAADRGDKGATDRLVERMAADAAKGADPTSTQPAAPPMLLWSPPIPQVNDPQDQQFFNTIAGTGDGIIRWADIGFQIGTDGRVGGARILRGSTGQAWAAPIMKTIGQRRYSASTVAPEQRYRIERWTLTEDYAVPGDSFVRRRSERPHFVELDVTSTAPAAIVPATPVALSASPSTAP